MVKPDYSQQYNINELPRNLQPLETLANNFWWSWASDGAAIFRDLDPHKWEAVEQNPLRLLRETASLRLWQAANNPNYVRRVTNLTEEFDQYLAAEPANFGDENRRRITAQNPAAYFCAEYGVHNSLPLYSGGLGILAGDHLKSASDLNVPLVAVGLFYRFGYFRQRIMGDGWQQENYLESLPANLAISPVVDENGERVRISVEMRGRTVQAQAWLARIGRVPLYLLDTNVAENHEIDRLITGHLYGGDRETRVVQEIILGIGGVRLLRKLKIEPAVFHLNEGHSAFLTLELAREHTESPEKLGFFDAAPLVRDKCAFTTHTPVAAGNDEFPPEMLEKCFDQTNLDALGLTFADFLTLGRTQTDDAKEWFGMTPLSLRMCRKSNGVSKKHGEVSRALWQKMFKAEEPKEVPITHITNGVHPPTWIAPTLRDLYEREVGGHWQTLLETPAEWKHAVERISDEELWQAHSILKSQLVAYIRERTARKLERDGQNASAIEAAGDLFDQDVLTVGFARRVAGYKRWNLLLADAERLLKMVDDPQRPVQFVFAGKAHPQDRGAKAVLQGLLAKRQNSQFARRAIFIEDYDQEVARYLVQGVDVWLNVPRRFLEASGTSGQKVAMNGGLNFSILDGWWIEGYDGTNGWAVGDLSFDPTNEAAFDAPDAAALYATLENEIIPEFYRRDESALPRQWIGRMRRAIETLTPQFSSNRMVRDYVEQIYCS